MSWQKVKLGDLCTIEKGKTGIQKAIPGEYPLVVTAEERKSHNEYQFDDVAVIIPLVSGTGHGHASIKRLHFQSGKFALGSILCAVIPKDKSVLNTEYLYRFLNLNKERELVDRMKGMANVTLPIKEIAKIEIPLPSLEEQIKFVEKYALLETDSEDISFEMESQLNLIKQLRQAFLREAMQGKLCYAELDSASQETGHELLAKIKAEKAKLIAEKKLKKEKELSPITTDEIPFKIPENWAWCRLGDLISFSKGKKRDILTKVKSDLYSIPYIDIAGFEKNIFFQYTTQSKAIICKKEDILLVWDGARMGLCGTNVEGAVGSTLIKICHHKISRDYLFFFLRMNFKYFNSNPKQAGLPHMNGDLFNNLLFALPPLYEQEQIVAKLEELMAFCDGLEQSIKESQGYNEKLLQQVLREALQG